MSYDSYKKFEESLEAARLKRRVPNINKKVFNKVLSQVETHNRNQEEQEMWMRHFSSKKDEKTGDSSDGESDERRRKKRKKCKTDRRKRKKEAQNNMEHTKNKNIVASDSTEHIGPRLCELYKPVVPKWGHDGFHELYADETNALSDVQSEEERTKKTDKSKKKKNKKKRKKETSKPNKSDDDNVPKKRKKT